MNNWFEVKVRYTKQLDNGTFKRVTESYLISAISFTDAEARVYEELGSTIRGEFIVTAMKRENLHDIFAYDDADVWYKSTISFQSESDEGGKSKAVKQTFLVTASSVKEATERINEGLKGLMADYVIKGTVESAIIDVFPFNSEDPAFDAYMRTSEVTWAPEDESSHKEALQNLKEEDKKAGLTPHS